MPPKKGAAAADEGLKGAARFARAKNTLQMGLCGLPNVGKSSLFNLLTKQDVKAENFPFCTIKPSLSRVRLPDPRFDALCEMWKSPSQIPAWLNVTDIAGLVKGASEGAGLGNDFLSNIQAMDGLFHVVRAFDNDEIVHVDDSVDPVRDLETIMTELCLKDLVFFQKAMEKEEALLRKNPKHKQTKEYEAFQSTMAKVEAHLRANEGIYSQEWTALEVQIIKDKLVGEYSLITTKPIIYLINLTAKDFKRKKNKYLKKIKDWIDSHGGGPMIPFSVEFEEEFAGLEGDAAAQAQFLEEAGCKSALPKITKAGYGELSLQSYFTAGEKEVRAWTVQKGSTAPQAAGVIHSDFERGFIKAEIAGWEDFAALQIADGNKPGMDKVKAAGKYRQEGKAYIMKDGDIVLFQFNVSDKGGKKK